MEQSITYTDNFGELVVDDGSQPLTMQAYQRTELNPVIDSSCQGDVRYGVELSDYELARDFILFNKNGFDQSSINPDEARRAYWDALERYPNHLSEQAKARAGVIVRAALRGQESHTQSPQASSTGKIALKNTLRIHSVNGDTTWRNNARCLDADPDAFFPEKGGSTREARIICAGCHVSEPCLEYALGNDERFGIWGGLSERERRREKRLRD